MNPLTRPQAPAQGAFTVSPLIWAMSKEEILQNLPCLPDWGDGNPYNFFIGSASAPPLAARLAHAAIYWQIQPLDAVRALAPSGPRFTILSLEAWMLGDRDLAKWEARSIGRLVHMLEHPETDGQVRGWWHRVREYLEREGVAYDIRQERRRM